ncbi:MAG TPA: NAD-glutamate dehydrogenase [Gammaproteobacteria bacterium]|nr:NAD-glutamate dehydrogenase [Gammaproteobacteria bacterium]
MPQTKQDPKTRHIERVLAEAEKKVDAAELPLIEAFIRLYYGGIAEEDLLERTPQNLFGAAFAHWQLARTRDAGTPLIRLYNPSAQRHGWKSTHTVCEIVNDDMPFLVDSLSMAFAKHGIGIHLTVHPIISVTRDKNRQISKVAPATAGAKGKAELESFVHMEVDRQTDAQLLKALEADIGTALADVRSSVNDWGAMRDMAATIAAGLDANKLPLAEGEVEEGKQFLHWLTANHFTFLGYREYDLVRENGEDILQIIPDSGLGILRDTGPDTVSKSFLVLPKDVRRRARAKELLIITKANSIATVHRPGYMDYIGVKRFNDAGEVIGERRFLGLFTSTAYSLTARNIPLLRHKVDTVMRRSGLPASSHGGKALLHILETFPRDELFQSTVDELYEIATGVLALQERQRVKLFIRRDAFGRFYSCLVYVPRDRYNTRVRMRIQDVLREHLHGKDVESAVQLSESRLARLHIIVRTTPWQFPKFEQTDIEDQIRLAVRSWEDQLHDALVAKFGEARGVKLFNRYGDYFHASYQEDVKPKAAVYDIEQIDDLTDDESLRMSLYRPTFNPKSLLRFKLFRREQPISISTALPMLENLGMNVISERPYEMELADGSMIWIQDFEMIYARRADIDPKEVKGIFQDAFARIWSGEAENDGFNKLVLGAELTWRETTLLRAYCKYLLQTGAPFSQAYMEQTLAANADIAKLMIELFDIRFDPAGVARNRDKRAQECLDRLHEKLDSVSSLDDDRILRSFINVIDATLRTNYFQFDANKQPKPYISLKFDPSKIPELPLPRPMFEIFVYSARFEAVHLRGGKVARGGIRWSDRREDFRTEVLGLMKAQMVKNTVIVPVGSKGGFFVKHPPADGDRDKLMHEVVACYQNFMRGMLDLTDNLVDGSVQPPRDVVRHDPDDPYLVVAADKGTATFSDIANGVAAEYDYWLGDAFASGGSAGYDHKKMGITARGGWESVKRHFREMGTDIQTTDFTVVGIGDMAGDVFGNGMLLSRHIKLIAAFNHMHIFLDPNPEPEASFQERERLFNLPRSTWEDYDASVISTGGGIYSRSAKQIPLSDEIRAALDIEAESLTPQELIRAILKAPVDLLWNGGIGTYVKAIHESSADVGDRANDTLRINGRELRCQVVGEGGNLGCTQLGRIEYALNGGRLNTDFVDNSAGVDTSDHEVNIKILLNMALGPKFSVEQRNDLLATMTDEIAALVLRNNYLQSQAITVAESQAAQRIEEHAYLIRLLERSGSLNRGLEYLPSEEDLIERRAAAKGLTRPELSVLLAYSKITIYSDLVDSDVPEDKYLGQELEDYFPTPLRRDYRALMDEHRLRREIIATATTNSIVNRMGPTFAHRMREETGANASAVARAYTIARETYGMREIWAAIEALDNKVPADVQTTMITRTARLLRHATRWLLDHKRRRLDIAAQVAELQPGITTLMHIIHTVLPEHDLESFNNEREKLLRDDVPEGLARRIAALSPLYAGMDIVEVAASDKLAVETVARAWFQLGARLDIDWLHEQVESLQARGHWQAVARGSLREDLYTQQRQLTAQVLNGCGKREGIENCVEKWLVSHNDRVQHTQRVVGDMKAAATNADFPTLAVALQEIRKLVQANGVKAS